MKKVNVGDIVEVRMSGLRVKIETVYTGIVYSALATQFVLDNISWVMGKEEGSLGPGNRRIFGNNSDWKVL
tara:strand:- start:482 stop:694 length:213 start_codon:yes stop_codon:yes gene_type:complete